MARTAAERQQGGTLETLDHCRKLPRETEGRREPSDNTDRGGGGGGAHPGVGRSSARGELFRPGRRRIDFTQSRSLQRPPARRWGYEPARRESAAALSSDWNWIPSASLSSRPRISARSSVRCLETVPFANRFFVS